MNDGLYWPFTPDRKIAVSAFARGRKLVLLLAVLLGENFDVGCTGAEETVLDEGVYQLCAEVSGFSGETIELKGGHFRYWFYSDVRGGETPTYPLLGTYSVRGTKLILEHQKVRSPERTIATLNGIHVLWRDDGLTIWEKDQDIHPYALLIRQAADIVGNEPPVPPSLEVVYTQAMRERRQKQYEERYNDQPVEVRSLLRAISLRGDPNLDTYKAEIVKARASMNGTLLSQLVGLMGNSDFVAIEASSILDDLFFPSYLLPEDPGRVGAARIRALKWLTDAFAAAKNRNALEQVLLVFLRASEVGEIALEIPQGGVRVSLRIIGGPLNRGSVYASGEWGNPADYPSDHTWANKMEVIIPPCQTWARERLSK